MAVTERMRDSIAPVMAELEVELVDIEHVGATVRITIDRPGGIDLELISRATRRISHLLDEVDPLADRYTLEVSSPGLERPLRRPSHFARAVGSTVAVKTVAGVEGKRRVTGRLLSAADDGIEIAVEAQGDAPRSIRYADIERARTVFEWGPSPKPGTPRSPKPTKKNKTEKAARP
ncbi:MAG: ribosome maturation factor RimP [Actinomycetota bacterium]|nr:ribosome maturation factor RimP [Actinomycetota bacterium]